MTRVCLALTRQGDVMHGPISLRDVTLYGWSERGWGPCSPTERQTGVVITMSTRHTKFVGLLLAAILLASCGSTKPVAEQATTQQRAPSTYTGVNHVSARFCQRLDDGRWTPNDSPDYAGPCKVDRDFVNMPPGDVEPRCYTRTPACTSTPSTPHRVHRRPKPAIRTTNDVTTTTSPPPTSSAAVEGPGSTSHGTDSEFCSTHRCIENFPNGSGYVVQCVDGEWSHSGGLSGACSDHGGES